MTKFYAIDIVESVFEYYGDYYSEYKFEFYNKKDISLGCISFFTSV